MGTFVLGILVGWLLEWLFFTYWIKGRSTGRFADCSGLQTELGAKNKEISALKADLNSLKESTVSTTNDIDDAKLTEKRASEKLSKQAKTAEKEVTIKEKTSSTKSSSNKPDTSKSKNKTANKKSAKSKSSTASKKATPKKLASKKLNKVTGDNFTKISGIGPSLSIKLNELGITTFQKLSEIDEDILRDMLEASGAKMNNNKYAMQTWNEQAALAAKNDFKGLKKLQKSLKS